MTTPSNRADRPLAPLLLSLLPGLLAASLAAPPVNAAPVGGPNTVRYRAGVVANLCNMVTTDGELAAQNDRTLISSDISQFGANAYSGSPSPATVAIRSNMGSTAVIVADQPLLSGTTAASLSQISMNGQSYGSIAKLNTNADGNLDADINVRFNPQGTAFQNGVYTATAIVTCTDDGNP